MLIILLCATVASCAGPETAGGPADSLGGSPTPESDVGMTIPDQVILLSKENLAGQLGISVGEITLLSAEAVLWADTSLGCPEPGVVYAQVEVPGYSVELLARGEAYTYHTDRGGAVVLCDWRWPMAVPATPKQGDIDDAQPWMPVY